MQETPNLLCYFGERKHKNAFWDAWKSNYGSWITASTFSWYFMHGNGSDRYEIGCRCDDYVLEAYSSVSTDYRKIYIRSVLVTLSPLRADECIFWCSDWNDPLMMDTCYRIYLNAIPIRRLKTHSFQLSTVWRVLAARLKYFSDDFSQLESPVFLVEISTEVV